MTIDENELQEIRKIMKEQITLLVADLKGFAEEYEELGNELDNLSYAEINRRGTEIEEKYEKKGIELFFEFEVE